MYGLMHRRVDVLKVPILEKLPVLRDQPQFILQLCFHALSFLARLISLHRCQWVRDRWVRTPQRNVKPILTVVDSGGLRHNALNGFLILGETYKLLCGNASDHRPRLDRASHLLQPKSTHFDGEVLFGLLQSLEFRSDLAQLGKNPRPRAITDR